MADMEKEIIVKRCFHVSYKLIEVIGQYPLSLWMCPSCVIQFIEQLKKLRKK